MYNQRGCGFINVVGGAGFEPTKAEPTDLQSAPFDRFGIPPEFIFKIQR